MKKILLILLLFTAASGFATHNRAGEILYTRIAPFTTVVGGVAVPVFNYSITIITYTDDGPGIADRCVDTVYFGDGQQGIAPRINGPAGCQGCNRCGDVIIADPNYRVKVNTYTITHTYSGAGSYLIRTFDPNRNAGVHNIPNSDQQPFYLESLLTINNFSGANSSPEFHNPPTDRACAYRCFYHNPGAYDVDGDSLSFEITTSRGENGQTVPGYFFPETGPNGVYGINAVTGLLTWCSPQFIDQYNIAFIVKEWRKNTSGVYEMIGYVLRDMQVIVVSCLNNPPVVTVPADTCIEAGTLIKKNIYVTDPAPFVSPYNLVTVTGASGAFASLSPNASLLNASTGTPYTAEFVWQTTCDHVREQPYQTVFKATDQGPGSPLVSFSTYNIRIVPPSVKNVTATPVGSTIKLSWPTSTCNPASNPLMGYRIYRKNDCTPYTYSPCATGVEPSSGYVLIGQVGQTSASTFTFTDNNNGNGLIVGQNYSYLVVAYYSDGTQSYASSQVCAKLKRDIPVLLNVDVRATSTTAGSIYVRWSKPLTNVGNLDTMALPGPFQFTLKYRSGSSGSFNDIYTSASPYFLSLDTVYTHNNINTSDSVAYYKVEFTAGTATVGSSQLASSVFLDLIPGDRKMNLSWTANTPWNNYKYTIERKDGASATYTPIAVTTLTTFTDDSAIVNRHAYCYKITAEGQYSDPTIYKPLINLSEEVCGVAKDLTIPCTPTLSTDADCSDTSFVTIKWTNVRNLCSDDVIKYVLFYKPTIADPYKIKDTLDLNTTSYTYDGLGYISGCFAIQSVDSSGNASIRSPDFCLDNCPEFELPNIFSPNGDNSNDFYKAIKVRQVKEIDLTIYDRWGNLVYKTKDPYFQWNGISSQSKTMVSEGTFFYFCDVFEPRLTGIRTRTIKGYLQMVK